MSYIKNIPIKVSVGNCINYIVNEDKTDGHIYISDSGIDWHIANEEWKRVREKYNKNSGILAHHFIQAFNPKHGVTPEEANRIGLELAQKQFGRLGFDFIVATHVNTGVIHNHILVNNVSRTTGRKYNHDKKTYRFLRQLNIDMCRNNGVPAVDSPSLDELQSGTDDIKLGKKYRSKPYIKTHAYDSWTQKEITNKKKIREDINAAIKISTDWEDFVFHMEHQGYRVDWKTKNGEDKKFVTYTPENAERGRRDRSLGMDWFSKQAIIERIEKEKAKREREEQYQKESVYKKTYQIKKVVIRKIRTEYYLDPNWDIRPLHFGKSKYRRRSWLESLIIRTFFQKRVVVERYKNPSSYSRVINKEMYEAAKAELEKSMRIFKFVQEHGIKRSDEAVTIRKQNELQIFIKNDEQEELKRRLLHLDNAAELFRDMESNADTFNEWNSLSGSEKESFYYANKQSIQQHALAKRKLEKLELLDKNLNEIETEQMQISEMITNLKNEITSIQTENDTISEVEAYVSELERREKKVKVREKEEAQNEKHSERNRE